MAHVENLPPEAMTHGTWRTGDELAAQQVELTHAVLRVSLAGYRLQLDRKYADKIKIPDPYHVPRPGDAVELEAKPAKKLSRDSIRRALLGG
jgi:cytochrome c1